GVWEKVGSTVQSVLVDAVERIAPTDQEAVRPLVVKVWDSALNSEITGTTWRANSVTLTGVTISFDNTGVVSGEFGMVDAIRRKKAGMERWRTDQRVEVRRFAETYMRQADLCIADEQRRAEARKALRELEYDDRKDGDDKRGEGGDESTWH